MWTHRLEKTTRMWPTPYKPKRENSEGSPGDESFDDILYLTAEVSFFFIFKMITGLLTVVVGIPLTRRGASTLRSEKGERPRFRRALGHNTRQRLVTYAIV